MEHAEDFDCSLQAPFSLIVSGMSQSGKSTLTGSILKRRNEIITTSDGSPIERVLYCYTEAQPKFFAELQQSIPVIKFHKGIPEDFTDGSDKPSLVVLDDLMTECGKSDTASNAVTRVSHHRNCSLIILVQNFFYKGLRSITGSVCLCMLFDNCFETCD
jgi:DNA replication protein DnaC